MFKDNEEMGRKFDGDKPRWELLPWKEVEEVVEILTFGANKYEDNNWQHVFPRARYVGASFRHLIAWAKGEKKDPESGKSHLAHAVCNLLFLMWSDNNDPQEATQEKYSDHQRCPHFVGEVTDHCPLGEPEDDEEEEPDKPRM